LNNEQKVLSYTECYGREKRNSAMNDVWEALKKKKEKQMETKDPKHLKI
jgi:hypothetical protein